jgi:hypothetical protein
MERNVGTIDRVVRIVVAILFIFANVAGWVTGIAGLVLAVLAGMLISSVASGHCPLYAKLGKKDDLTRTGNCLLRAGKCRFFKRDC